MQAIFVEETTRTMGSTRNNPFDHEGMNYQRQLGLPELIHYASTAAKQMNFQDAEELNEAVLRAMSICRQAGMRVENHFRHIFRPSLWEMEHDWKLSKLAYRLVCLNGKPTNINVADLHLTLAGMDIILFPEE